MDGMTELDLGLPDQPLRPWRVTFTSRRQDGGEPLVPCAAGHPAVMAAYTAEQAIADVAVVARGRPEAVAAAEEMCSGLEWVARATAEVVPLAWTQVPAGSAPGVAAVPIG